MPDPQPVLSTHGLRQRHLERPILDDVTFTVNEGDRVALVGANGAGKSTLMRILAGRLQPDGGEVRVRRGLKVTYLDQEGGLEGAETVGEAVAGAFADQHVLEAELEQLNAVLEHDHESPEAARALQRQSEIIHRLEHLGAWDRDARMATIMQQLGVPPADRRLAQLSGGERRRTALARALLEGADLLLLDEPTNHLDAETLDWLEQWLEQYRGTVIFVTHDRYFLDNVATRLIELARGAATAYQGNYTDYMEAKAAEAELARRAESTRQNLLRRELEWLRRQPKARTTKSKARIDRAEELMANKPLAEAGSVQLLIPPGPRLGNLPIEIEGISYSIPGRRLIDNFSMLIGPRDRIGIVGRNGLGKTTLIRLLMGELEPQSGRITRSPHVRFLYADQSRATLDPQKSVLEEVTGGAEYIQIGTERVNFRAWMARFLFDDQMAAMPVGLLSGGERNRVLLAKLIREGGNVVVLDEPTNDLDLPTLRVLEESLAAFDGCALVVSHDRYFLNRVATRILAFRPDGRIDIVEGNYDDYRAYLARTREATPAARPAAAPPAPAPTAAPAATTPRRKLSYSEQREFETIEERIIEAEQKLAALEARAHDPATFAAASREDARRLLAEVDAARAEVERLYARWEELGARA
jgi:ATP-binding cassette subfamily F protein uup